MTFLLAGLGGIAGAIAGFIVVAAIIIGLSGSSGSADAAAGRMMAAMFVIAPLGGLAGLVLGTRYTLKRLRGTPSWAATFGHSAITLVAGAGIAGAVTYWAIDQTDTIARPNQAALQLDFEIRLPAGMAAPEPVKAARIELRTDMNRMPGELIPGMTRTDGERAVIGGRVEVYFRTSNRSVALMIPNQPEQTFPIKLPARPPVSDTYSRWEPAHAPHANREINVDFDIRYRIVDPVVSRRPQ